MNKKIKIVLISIIITIVILISMLFFRKKNSNSIVLQGNVEIRTVRLGFKVPGRIKHLLCKRGRCC